MTIEISSGYRFLPGIVVNESFEDLGTMPSTWVSISKDMGDNTYIGLTLLYNEDKISQNWPELGNYYHNRKQIGIGAQVSHDLYEKNRYSMALSYSFGLTLDQWSVDSNNPILEQSILPKEYNQRIFGMLCLKHNYAIHENLTAFVKTGLGENNALLGITIKL